MPEANLQFMTRFQGLGEIQILEVEEIRPPMLRVYFHGLCLFVDRCKNDGTYMGATKVLLIDAKIAHKKLCPHRPILTFPLERLVDVEVESGKGARIEAIIAPAEPRPDRGGQRMLGMVELSRLTVRFPQKKDEQLDITAAVRLQDVGAAAGQELGSGRIKKKFWTKGPEGIVSAKVPLLAGRLFVDVTTAASPVPGGDHPPDCWAYFLEADPVQHTNCAVFAKEVRYELTIPGKESSGFDVLLTGERGRTRLSFRYGTSLGISNLCSPDPRPPIDAERDFVAYYSLADKSLPKRIPKRVPSANCAFPVSLLHSACPPGRAVFVG